MNYEYLLYGWRQMETTLLSLSLSRKLVPERPKIVVYLIKLINKKLDYTYFWDKQLFVLLDEGLIDPIDMKPIIEREAPYNMWKWIPEFQFISPELYTKTIIAFPNMMYEAAKATGGSDYMLGLRKLRLENTILNNILAHDIANDLKILVENDGKFFPDENLWFCCVKFGAIQCFQYLASLFKLPSDQEVLHRVFACRSHPLLCHVLQNHQYKPDENSLNWTLCGPNHQLFTWLVDNNLADPKKIDPSFYAEIWNCTMLLKCMVYEKDLLITPGKSIPVIHYLLSKGAVFRGDLTQWFKRGFIDEAKYLIEYAEAKPTAKCLKYSDFETVKYLVGLDISPIMSTANDLQYILKRENGVEILKYLLENKKLVDEDGDVQTGRINIVCYYGTFPNFSTPFIHPNNEQFLVDHVTTRQLFYRTEMVRELPLFPPNPPPHTTQYLSSEDLVFLKGRSSYLIVR